MNMTDLCQELHNWFDINRYFGEFEIVDGEILASELQDNQFFRIIGSVFNDGVHQKGHGGLHDEKFKGAIWAMAVPPTVLRLIDKIDSWETTYGDIVNSPYSSESFGGYSYTKASGRSTPNGGSSSTMTYVDVFNKELNRWRKV